jgi:carboxyl-terminal processing protease
MPGALDSRTPAQIEKYLADALRVIQRKALDSASVDWDAVHAEARETAAQAQSYAGTHRLLNRVLKQAGGKHSHMALSYRLPGAVERAATAGAWTTSAAGSGSPPLPEGMLIEGAAYLSLPRLSRRSGGPLLARRYVSAGSRLVGRLAVPKPHGWIVDLRQNTGGNMWPMIAAVAGLLECGVLGHFLLPGGQRQAWCLNRWYVSLGGKPIARVHGLPRCRGEAPLAVLISARTASAGEAALVALQAQSPARTFGTATAGMTTGNITHVLPDGTRLMISTCHYADSAGHLISGPIQPDEPANPDDDRNALTQALAWIAGNGRLRATAVTRGGFEYAERPFPQFHIVCPGRALK